tara:strand:- start:702 stop:1427 length:726 start_codon:yes stop_codon:yes gene_type:complete
MKICVIFIGTNKYSDFFPGYYAAVKRYFLPDFEKTFYVFTDLPKKEYYDKEDVVITEIEHVGWPWITLHRFKFMNYQKDNLAKFDYVFFLDADLWPCSNIGEEIIAHGKPYIGVHHPGFIGKIGTFETNPMSRANIFDKKYDLSIYRQGCFWGGKAEYITKMCAELNKRVDSDTENNVVAIWHDESHMNKYFLENNDNVYTLHPGFATPQNGYEYIKQNYKTMMVHLHKDIKEFPRFEGVK